jgi:hypothetical protein
VLPVAATAIEAASTTLAATAGAAAATATAVRPSCTLQQLMQRTENFGMSDTSAVLCSEA